MKQQFSFYCNIISQRRNQTKTLLGIETFGIKSLPFLVTSRNQTKTLLGIETPLISNSKAFKRRRNQTKTLLGIETITGFIVVSV